MTPNAHFKPRTENINPVILKNVRRHGTEESSITTGGSSKVPVVAGVPFHVLIHFSSSGLCYERTFATADAGIRSQ